MNYIDVYFSRINHMGETTAERIRNGGIKSFEKWLSESPHTIRNLSVERGIYFDGIILTSKDKEYEKIMFLEVANNVPLLIGDIMNWTLDDGSIEKWIIIQEEKKVNGTFRSFWIVRCNYLMKWIDAQGHLQQSWAYFVSSLDSKIKGNFRTWNNLITPQPNKYAELLMPRYPIDRATNFIVEEESWTVVEYDHTSVPGVIYLSLIEDKINSIYDDVENNVADLDKKAKYSFIIPDAVPQIFTLGAHIEPFFTIMKNGKPYLNKPEEQEEKAKQLEYIIEDKKIVKNIDGALIAVKKGTTQITAIIKNAPEVTQVITVRIGEQEEQTEFSLYIEGNDKIRLDHKENYVFQYTGVNKPQDYIYKLFDIELLDWEDDNSIPEEYPCFKHPKLDKTYIKLVDNNMWEEGTFDNIEQQLENFSAKYKYSKLGTIKYQYDQLGNIIKNNGCILHANDKNKLGYAILGCIYYFDDKIQSSYKLVEVAPLW